MTKKTLGLAVGAAMLLSVAAPAAALADTTTTVEAVTTTAPAMMTTAPALTPAVQAATTVVPATTVLPVGTTATQTVPSLGAAFATFDQGGGDLGRGLAELISGAVIGLPQAVTVLPCEVAGANAPAPCAYTG